MGLFRKRETYGAGALLLEVHQDGDSARLALHGEFDLSCADYATRVVQELLRRGLDAVILDLSGLEFMDSTGVRFLVEARDAAREHGVRVSLVNGGDAVRRVLEVSGVGALFDIGRP